MRLVSVLLSVFFLSVLHAADIRDCVEIESDEERLRCYDDLAMRSAGMAPEPPAAPEPSTAPEPAVAAAPPSAPESLSVQQQPTPTPEAEQAVAATPEELFGKSDEEKNAAIAEAAGVEDVSSISTSVTSVTSDLHGKMTINLDNGQRWRQVRAERFDVGVGDEVVIKRAILGSFTLQNKSGGRKTKVRRVD